MALLETPRFPACVSFGALGGPMFSTVRTVVASGHDDVLIRYEQPIHRYTFEHANQTQFQHDELKKFFMAVKGMGHPFRVKDYADFTVLESESSLRALHSGMAVGTVGFGYGVPDFVLQKKYTTGAFTTYRNIHTPITGFVVERGGVVLVFGASAGNIAINSQTGKITFVADQSKGVNSHTPGADHVFTLSAAFSPNVSIGQRVFASGIAGTAADTLNNLSHEVTNVSSAVVTIATSTAGLTATGGTVALYPQSTEALTWYGEFDVPCRFLSDEASYQIVERAGDVGLLYSWSGINLTEIRIAL